MIQPQRGPRATKIFPQFAFLCLTFLSAVIGALVGLRLFSEDSERSAVPDVITVEVIVTTTPLPAKLEATAPSAASRQQVALPADIAAEAASASVATVDAQQLGARDAVAGRPTVAIAGGPVRNQRNCLIHTIRSGDSPYSISFDYFVGLELLMEVNELTEQSARSLKVGDQLIVPLPGCIVDGVAVAGSIEPVVIVATQAPSPTPTAVPVRLEIAAVEGLGDITAEGIYLRNLGEQINISEWRLTDSAGNSFQFGQKLLFGGGEVAVYTRSGISTGSAWFWGRDQSVWEAGETMTISDSLGRELLTLQIPEDTSDE
ncbi:MAG: LysM peptidoglycan-binding domain-containing protein [Chloroflexi bacterium]|nr:LysM peptidoglycan-binding domain-containing protein [Chloroflexota bacterium]MCY4246685.1 LysM peptidoglycan-binding domain-containing protein [Chloroflexota bacterium]